MHHLALLCLRCCRQCSLCRFTSLAAQLSSTEGDASQSYGWRWVLRGPLAPSSCGQILWEPEGLLQLKGGVIPVSPGLLPSESLVNTYPRHAGKAQTRSQKLNSCPSWARYQIPTEGCSLQMHSILILLYSVGVTWSTLWNPQTPRDKLGWRGGLLCPSCWSLWKASTPAHSIGSPKRNRWSPVVGGSWFLPTWAISRRPQIIQYLPLYL